jgi:ATP-dependent helicase/nuclease subunit B
VRAFIPFDLLGGKVNRDEFIETLAERLSSLDWPDPQQSRGGVALLHAEAARGLGFRVVFLIGVEEKVFPRIIREDAFLRDDARIALSNTLGYKISQKLSAFEEEQLLFELITTSASEKLFITYQRSDDDGRVVGPSPFLHGAENARLIPRSYTTKRTALSPAEASRRDVVSAYLATGDADQALRFAEKTADAPAQLKGGLAALRHLQSFSEPGAHDGVVAPVVPETLSPSRMEMFSRCPFQYFALNVLELETPEETPAPTELPAKLKGELIHKFFETFFRALVADSGKEISLEVPGKLFDRVFNEVFGQLDPAALGVHAVVWESFLTAMRRDLRAVLESDVAALARAGRRPMYFEQPVTERLDAPLDRFAWQGKIDRIDVSENGARVVDYKTGRRPKEAVVTGAVQGRQLQGPLYLLLAEKFLRAAGVPAEDLSFAYSYLDPENPQRELSREDWSAHKEDVLKSLGALLDVMGSGRFPIMPGDYCSWCEVASLCRVSDSLSVYRSRQDAAAEKLRALRAKRAGKKK